MKPFGRNGPPRVVAQQNKLVGDQRGARGDGSGEVLHRAHLHVASKIWIQFYGSCGQEENGKPFPGGVHGYPSPTSKGKWRCGEHRREAVGSDRDCGMNELGTAASAPQRKEPSTTRINGVRRPSEASRKNLTKSSPFSQARNGLWERIFGIRGKAPRTRSSMLGCVAAVTAIVSPSQPRPALSHNTSMTAGEPGRVER